MKNHEIFLQYQTKNKYDLLDIHRQSFKKLPDNLEPFAYGESPKYPSLVHFFIDDKRFETVWTHPFKSLEILKSEKIWAVCGPDFSMYADFPEALQIYQIWRNRVLMRFWSDNGIRVIPSIMFSNHKSLEYSFIGIEKHQIVAMPVPARMSVDELKNFDNGYQSMLIALEPRLIICFGQPFGFMLIDGVPKKVFPKGHFKTKSERIKHE